MSTINQFTGRSAYKRLMSHLKPYRSYIIIGVIATLLISGVDSFFAWLIKPMINQMFGETQNIWVKFLPLIVFCLFAFRALATFTSSSFINRSSRFVIMDLRKGIFNRLITLPLNFFSRSKTGELVSLVVYNVEQVSDATSQTIVNALQDTALVIGLLVMMLTVSWKMSLFILLVCPCVYFLLRYLTKRTRMLSHRVQDSIAHLITVTQECLRGLVLIRIHGTAEVERKRFGKYAQENRQQSLKVVVTNAVSSSLVQVFLAIPVSLILLVASKSWIHISAGSFASLITAMIMIIKPVRRLATTNSNIQKGIAGAESIFELLNEEPESLGGNKDFELAPGNWAVNNLGFSYENEKHILKDVSFSVEAGQTIALVGASGGGKSTLVKILSSLYSDYSGELEIDGVSLREYSMASLRTQVAYVGQESVVFSTTVADNIAYGAHQIDEERVWRCLELAQLADWVRQQEAGLYASVGELGASLSGGQRQRLSIARALYRDVPITILDEATSALDYETERKIQLAIESLKDRKTLFVVAHRLSTIEAADNILVMHEGRLVEQGTHRELLMKSGYYKKLYSLQSKGSVVDEALSG
jgi:ATP-binding cassette, subfamily B, bacterial MsbA